MGRPLAARHCWAAVAFTWAWEAGLEGSSGINRGPKASGAVVGQGSLDVVHGLITRSSSYVIAQGMTNSRGRVHSLERILSRGRTGIVLVRADDRFGTKRESPGNHIPNGSCPGTADADGNAFQSLAFQVQGSGFYD